MPPDRIGNLEVIDTKSFLIPPGESVWLDINAGGWIVKVNLIFQPNAAAQGLRIVPMSDHAQVYFDKWDNTLGTATTRPIQLGTRSDGKILYFMATNYTIGGTNKCDLQFFLGGAL